MNNFVLSCIVAVSVSAAARTASATPAEVAEYATWSPANATHYLAYLDALSFQLSDLKHKLDEADCSRAASQIMGLQSQLWQLTNVVRDLRAGRRPVDAAKYRRTVFAMDRHAYRTVRSALDTAVDEHAEQVERARQKEADSAALDSQREELDGGLDSSYPLHL